MSKFGRGLLRVRRNAVPNFALRSDPLGQPYLFASPHGTS